MNSIGQPKNSSCSDEFCRKHCLTKFFSWCLGRQPFTQMQIFLLFVQPFVIHSCYFCCTRNCRADRTGWCATYSIDNDIDTGLRVWNRLKMYCFIDLSTFFTWWSHANFHIAKAVRYVYYAIKFTNCQNFILKKTYVTGFFIIKSSHPDGLKKNRSGWKKTGMGTLKFRPIQFIFLDP